ncbi:hypothetical protein BB560_004074 [Smittium megazygosporum]|uniref:SLM1/RGC1-like BAR-like domain-containing protein n=1 Tax=Smittium megazygosporum TaxID=133381 RepID=A0A2T9ZAE8_9FUNG|nr:hypothetical protein BB560_004074 [Smittium megazygosporum]
MGNLFKTNANKHMSMPVPPRHSEGSVATSDSIEYTPENDQNQSFGSDSVIPVGSQKVFETPAFRIKKVKQIIGFYTVYFKRTAKAEKAYIKSMKKTNDMPDPLNQPIKKKNAIPTMKKSHTTVEARQEVDEVFTSDSDKGISSLLNDIKSAQSRNLDHRQMLADKIQNNIVPGLEGLKKRVNNYISSYYKVMESKYLALKTQNNKIEKKLGKLEKSIQDSKIKSKVTDPMVTKTDLEKDIKMERDLEAQFQKSIDEELEKIKKWEVHVVEDLRKIIKDYYSFKIDELGNEKAIFDRSFQDINNFNYEGEWTKFETKVRKDIASQVAMNEVHSSKVNAIGVKSKDLLTYVAEGPIKMKGRFKSYKDYYAVLTSGKFFNVYKTKESFVGKEMPVTSLHAAKMDLLLRDRKGVYALYQKDAGIFNSAKTMFMDTLDTPTLHCDIGPIKKDKVDETSKLSWYMILYETIVKKREPEGLHDFDDDSEEKSVSEPTNKGIEDSESLEEESAEPTGTKAAVVSDPGPSMSSSERKASAKNTNEQTTTSGSMDMPAVKLEEIEPLPDISKDVDSTIAKDLAPEKKEVEEMNDAVPETSKAEAQENKTTVKKKKSKSGSKKKSKSKK